MEESALILKSFEFNGINDNEMRKFECWGSVEVLDRHGEIIPFEEVYKIMDIWMDRGAPIMFNHTNRQVGKGVNWRPAEKNGNKGVLITGVIYKHYKEDDEVWESIKKGEFEGLSIGGKAYHKEPSEEGTYLRDLIGYEFSLVNRCGNQEATFTEVNTMAKSEDIIEMKKEEEPIMEEPTSNDQPEDKMAKIEQIVASLIEKIAQIEEKISGKNEEDKPVEEQKACGETKKEEEEEEEKQPEKEDDETEDMKKQLESLKKENEELKKSTEVMKTISTERPIEVPVDMKKADNKYNEVLKSVDEMAKSGHIDFAKIAKQIRG